MHHFIPYVVCILLCGCGVPKANAPMLHLTVTHDGVGESIGTYRVSNTGLVAGSGDGASTCQAITVDKIADDGVTVTISISDSDTGNSSKQFLVPYDKEITVAISKEATVKARMERKK